MANYKEAGVDVEAGYEAVKLMRGHVQKTYRPEVMADIGGFGSLFKLDLSKFKEPVLVSGTDGVGTKLKLAFVMNKVDTVGQDCVAMCVNDVVCSGAEPLLFLVYIAVGKNEPQVIADIVKGVAGACEATGCSLVGGETAEMPGFYKVDEFDLAGFAVACVDKSNIINGSTIQPGDVLIGLPSSGVHSNGFSLVRKIFEPIEESYTEYADVLGAPLGEVLLTPTKLYVKTVLDLIEHFNIKGISHITGGGFYENIPRMGSKELSWNIKKGTWPILPIFELLAEKGNVDEHGMFNTFNMGIGMIMAVAPQDADAIVSYLKNKGEAAYIIGEVGSGNGEVTIC